MAIMASSLKSTCSIKGRGIRNPVIHVNLKGRNFGKKKRNPIYLPNHFNIWFIVLSMKKCITDSSVIQSD